MLANPQRPDRDVLNLVIIPGFFLIILYLLFDSSATVAVGWGARRPPKGQRCERYRERSCQNQVIAARLGPHGGHDAVVGLVNGRSLVQTRIDGASGDAVSSLKKRLSWASDSTRLVRVVCLTGMPGCGKEEALAVAQTLGFSVVRMGDVVREEALRRGLPITDATVGGMANAERP